MSATSPKKDALAESTASITFVTLLVAFQVAMIILYGVGADYSSAASVTGDSTVDKGGIGNYPLFQDVHIMIYIGFGFLMTFIHTNSWTAVGLNFLLSALAFQWSMLTNAFFVQANEGTLHEGIKLDVNSLINGDFGAAALMITYGGVLGKVSAAQMVVVCFLEMIIYSINCMIVVERLSAVDMGGSMVIHAFGAYFGIALTWMLGNPAKDKASPTMTKWSSTVSIIGTIFLWCFWPSFNGALARDSQQHRVIINTTLSIASSCIMTFAISRLTRPGKKFDFEDMANATLAGGVAVGSSCDLVIRPWGALLTGSVAGTISTLGFVFLSPLLNKYCGIHDTCGINNLHGMPGILGGIAGAISAGSAGIDAYGSHIGAVFHARAPSDPVEAAALGIEPGIDRSAIAQGGFQMAGLLISLCFGIAGGILAGAIIKLPIFTPMTHSFYNDKFEFHVDLEDVPHEDAHADHPLPTATVPAPTDKAGDQRGVELTAAKPVEP